MTANFWQNLPKPFFVLAPMEEVTDCSFREMFAKYGKPDVIYTEFVSVEGLVHEEGRKRLMIDLSFTERQRPIVAQIWGRDTKKFYQAAQLLAELGFDGIDINMGCPKKKEVSLKTCAALIEEPQLAQEIIFAVKEGAKSAGRPVPVSVKTRLGYNQNIVQKWVGELLKAEPAVIVMHGRTKKQASNVPADWQGIAEAVKVRDSHGSKTLIVGNGDVQSLSDGLRKAAASGVDGVMVGRATFGNPWFFCGQSRPPTLTERLSAMVEHAFLFEELFGKSKPFVILRKHFKAYARGFDGAHVLRRALMQAKDAQQVQNIAQEFLRHHTN